MSTFFLYLKLKNAFQNVLYLWDEYTAHNRTLPVSLSSPKSPLFTSTPKSINGKRGTVTFESHSNIASLRLKSSTSCISSTSTIHAYETHVLPHVYTDNYVHFPDGLHESFLPDGDPALKTEPMLPYQGEINGTISKTLFEKRIDKHCLTSERKVEDVQFLCKLQARFLCNTKWLDKINTVVINKINKLLDLPQHAIAYNKKYAMKLLGVYIGSFCNEIMSEYDNSEEPDQDDLEPKDKIDRKDLFTRSKDFFYDLCNMFLNSVLLMVDSAYLLSFVFFYIEDLIDKDKTMSFIVKQEISPPLKNKCNFLINACYENENTTPLKNKLVILMFEHCKNALISDSTWSNFAFEEIVFFNKKELTWSSSSSSTTGRRDNSITEHDGDKAVRVNEEEYAEARTGPGEHGVVTDDDDKDSDEDSDEDVDEALEKDDGWYRQDKPEHTTEQNVGEGQKDPYNNARKELSIDVDNDGNLSMIGFYIDKTTEIVVLNPFKENRASLPTLRKYALQYPTIAALFSIINKVNATDSVSKMEKYRYKFESLVIPFCQFITKTKFTTEHESVIRYAIALCNYMHRTCLTPVDKGFDKEELDNLTYPSLLTRTIVEDSKDVYTLYPNRGGILALSPPHIDIMMYKVILHNPRFRIHMNVCYEGDLSFVVNLFTDIDTYAMAKQCFAKMDPRIPQGTYIKVWKVSAIHHARMKDRLVDTYEYEYARRMLNILRLENELNCLSFMLHQTDITRYHTWKDRLDDYCMSLNQVALSHLLFLSQTTNFTKRLEEAGFSGFKDHINYVEIIRFGRTIACDVNVIDKAYNQLLMQTSQEMVDCILNIDNQYHPQNEDTHVSLDNIQSIVRTYHQYNRLYKKRHNWTDKALRPFTISQMMLGMAAFASIKYVQSTIIKNRTLNRGKALNVIYNLYQIAHKFTIAMPGRSTTHTDLSIFPTELYPDGVGRVVCYDLKTPSNLSLDAKRVEEFLKKPGDINLKLENMSSNALFQSDQNRHMQTAFEFAVQLATISKKAITNNIGQHFFALANVYTTFNRFLLDNDLEQFFVMMLTVAKNTNADAYLKAVQNIFNSLSVPDKEHTLFFVDDHTVTLKEDTDIYHRGSRNTNHFIQQCITNNGNNVRQMVKHARETTCFPSISNRHFFSLAGYLNHSMLSSFSLPFGSAEMQSTKVFLIQISSRQPLKYGEFREIYSPFYHYFKNIIASRRLETPYDAINLSIHEAIVEDDVYLPHRFTHAFDMFDPSYARWVVLRMTKQHNITNLMYLITVYAITAIQWPKLNSDLSFAVDQYLKHFLDVYEKIILCDDNRGGFCFLYNKHFNIPSKVTGSASNLRQGEGLFKFYNETTFCLP